MGSRAKREGNPGGRSTGSQDHPKPAGGPGQAVLGWEFQQPHAISRHTLPQLCTAACPSAGHCKCPAEAAAHVKVPKQQWASETDRPLACFEK